MDREDSEEERSKFLRHLPPNTSEYQYSGFEGLEEAMMQEYEHFMQHDHHSPFVVFKDIIPSEIEKHQEQFPGKVDYCYPLQTLILKMSTRVHEECAEAFGGLLREKAWDMAVRSSISFRGASDVKGSDRKKQADRSWAPRDPTSTGRSDYWPTVVLEVAFSETKEKVQKDAAWWLNGSDGDVQKVVTVDIKRPSGNIYITAWECPSGATSDEPIAVQQVKIYRRNGGEDAYVDGNDLVIPFQQLLLRDPDKGEGESNFVFTKEELLRDVGGEVWNAMDRMR